MRVKRVLLSIFLWILRFSSILSSTERSEVSKLSGTGAYDPALTRFPVRSLKSLTPNPDTALVAALDGTVNLVDSDSRTVIWSFPSGPPIYSSYQAPVNQDIEKENSSGASSGFFIDVGNDWELYAHNEHFGKMKLTVNIDEFIKSTPLISEDGSVTLGSRKSTVFEVDALTGRLIRTYGMPDSPATSPINMEEPVLYSEKSKDLIESGSMTSDGSQLRLKITRTDYSLLSFSSNSDKVLWNMTVAEIGAALICQDDGSSFGGVPLSSQYQLGAEFESPFKMPLSCHSKALVYRFRNPDIYNSFSGSQFHEVKQLPAPGSRNILPYHPKPEESLDFQTQIRLDSPNLVKEMPSGDAVAAILSLRAPEMGHSGVVNKGELTPSASALIAFLLVLFIATSFGYLIYSKSQVAREQANQEGEANLKTQSKRKRVRKSGKSSGSSQTNEKNTSSENEDGFANGNDDDDAWTKLTKIVEGSLDGRRIGKLFVSTKEIAKGSNGTIVLEGIYEGRPVAVKRLVQAHHDVAFKEIQNLIASDRHSNIVRWYGVEYDQDFVYLSLERCSCSLDDMIQIYSDCSKDSLVPEDPSSRAMMEYNVRLDSVRETLQDLNLWRANGHPSPLMLKLMRDVVLGLVHLHELGIIHRDLKPQNVLIIKERSLHAKLSDMGISRRLHGDMSSLGYHATGCGSSGWQAPEQLLHGRQTRAVDVFSLGCVLFFCITGGRHPFGDRFERDVNIVKNKMDLFLVEFIPEAVDLFSHLLNPDPELRPKALEVPQHPLFWSSEMRLSFLRDTSDRVELEHKEANFVILQALESTAPVALGGRWDEKMDSAFLTNIGKYRRYKFDNVKDLLRVMRNKLNHYRELPKEIQELIGSVPEGFNNYFGSRFPKLLIEVYRVMFVHCREEECFQKYFNNDV